MESTSACRRRSDQLRTSPARSATSHTASREGRDTSSTGMRSIRAAITAPQSAAYSRPPSAASRFIGDNSPCFATASATTRAFNATPAGFDPVPGPTRLEGVMR